MKESPNPKPYSVLERYTGIMSYSGVLKNEYFNNIAAIIRVPFRSVAWREEHAQFPFWPRIKQLDKLKSPQLFNDDKQAFIDEFMLFLADLTQTDPRLTYTTEDLAWFLHTMSSDHALAIASLLFAWFSAPDEMLTPADMAECTGMAASTWRNKAAAGEVPGAIKKGKQWLIPAHASQSRG